MNLDFLNLVEEYKNSIANYQEDLLDFDNDNLPKGVVLHKINKITELRAALYALKSVLNEHSAASNFFIVCDLSDINDASIISAAIILDKMGANGFLINQALLDENPSLIEDIEDVSKMPVLEYSEPLIGTQMLELYYGQSRFITEEATFTLLPSLPQISLIDMAFPERREHRNKYWHTVLLANKHSYCKLGTNHEPQIIAENFNFAITPELKTWILEEKYDEIFNFCAGLVANGAKIININLDPLTGIDDKNIVLKMLDNLLPRLNNELDIYLTFDIQDSEILEFALQKYDGRALINSVYHSENDEHLKFTLARNYGSPLVFMPITENSIPESAEERCVIIKDMLINARSYGLKASDFILDPVILPVKNNMTCANETLRTLRIFKETFNQPTIVGLSNISFGNEDRLKLHKLYLPMLLCNFLSLPIMNVSDGNLVETFEMSKDILSCHKIDCK